MTTKVKPRIWTTVELLLAHAGGFESGKLGKRLIDCPFLATPMASAWRRGFEEGAAAYKLKDKP